MLDWVQANGRATQKYKTAAGQACFEMARMLANVNLKQAIEYKRERVSRRTYFPTGPAAPASYQMIHRFLGFGIAERIASWRRAQS